MFDLFDCFLMDAIWKYLDKYTNIIYGMFNLSFSPPLVIQTESNILSIVRGCIHSECGEKKFS